MLKYFSNYLQVYLSTSIYVFIRNMKISLNIVSRDSMIFDWNVESSSISPESWGFTWNIPKNLVQFCWHSPKYLIHSNKNQIGMCEWGTRHNNASNYSKILFTTCTSEGRGENLLLIINFLSQKWGRKILIA